MTMPLFPDFFPPHVVTLVSDRRIDYTLKEGQATLSERQQVYLEQRLGFVLPEPVQVKQEHGSSVLFVSQKWPASGGELEPADGLLTDVSGLPLAVRTADCLPIFICDVWHDGICLLHAGWRGTRLRIVDNALHLMRRCLGTRAEDLRVAFGPAIRACCYEVGKEFREYFPGGLIQRNGRLFFDLVQSSREMLRQLGVKENQMADCGVCTCCDQRYFSYRREGRSTGRMISLMMLKK